MADGGLQYAWYAGRSCGVRLSSAGCSRAWAADQDELDDFIVAVITQFAEAHHKVNLGAPLLRKIAAQAHRRLKYLP